MEAHPAQACSVKGAAEITIQEVVRIQWATDRLAEDEVKIRPLSPPK